MINRFTYTGLPARVIFGAGCRAEAAAELDHLGVGRALVLATPRQGALVRQAMEGLGSRAAGQFLGAVMHTPIAVTEQAMQVVRETKADSVVSVGGGSTIGLGKAIALRIGLPQLVMPSTYSGSEMTPVLGQTQDGIKTTQRTLDVLPETVIYDPELTLDLPAGVSVTSGINAIAHAAEALYARDGNPIITLMAEQGAHALAQALPDIVAAPRNPKAREQALYGAWLCGTTLAATASALHHKLCHVLGGAFDLPHAETHTVILPHALAYNAPAAPEAMARLAAALGVANAAQGLYDLAGRLGAPRALSQLGMPRDGIDRAAALAMANPYWNPRALEEGALRALIARAWAGVPPD
jgi:maleylacetate reductase